MVHKPGLQLVKKVKEVLSKDIIQRIIYGFGLALWTWILWDVLSERVRYSTSSVGINYLTLYLVPALILGLQIIRNNKILWGLVLGLFTTYILIALFWMVGDIIERSGNHIKAIEWSISDFILLLLTFTVFGFIDWVIFQMRPKRLM